MLNGLTWVHWANSRITEKESNVKNKENGSDGALCWNNQEQISASEKFTRTDFVVIVKEHKYLTHDVA